VPVTWETYERVSLEDDENWELHDGRLRAKPAATWAHNDAVSDLGFALAAQLDRRHFSIRMNAGRVRCSTRQYHLTCYVPDVFVVPYALTVPLRGRPEALEVYDDPVSLVVEVWDPPTFEYDTDAKIPLYQQHGDAEIWRLHPFERTLTGWRKRGDGRYDEAEYRGGTVEVASLPGVAVDLDALFGR
jgi:Uma2 family endonuclease